MKCLSLSFSNLDMAVIELYLLFFGVIFIYIKDRLLLKRIRQERSVLNTQEYKQKNSVKLEKSLYE